MFLLQYVSEDLDNREKIIVMGDCCYLNPLVRRTFHFLGTCFGGNLPPYYLPNAYCPHAEWLPEFMIW